MTKEQYLLTCLAEEAAELSHAALKAVRFGLNDDFQSDVSLRPRAMVEAELVDVCATMRLLRREGILEDDDGFITKSVEIKIKKIKFFMEYSRERGRLDKV